MGTDPPARSRPADGGAITALTVPSSLRGSRVTPRRVSCIATSAEEPQPWDRESPMRSLGFQTSQVKVPPAATMWAQPGMDGVGEETHHGRGHVRRRQSAQELEAVVRADVDAEAGHVAPDGGQVGGRHHAVGERQCVGLLRGVGTLRAVGIDAVHVDAVGAAQRAVDRVGQLRRPALPELCRRRVAGDGGDLRHPAHGVHRQHVAGGVGRYRQVVAVHRVTVVGVGQAVEEARPGLACAPQPVDSLGHRRVQRQQRGAGRRSR